MERRRKEKCSRDEEEDRGKRRVGVRSRTGGIVTLVAVVRGDEARSSRRLMANGSNPATRWRTPKHRSGAKGMIDRLSALLLALVL